MVVAIQGAIAPSALGLAPVQDEVEIGASLSRGEQLAAVLLVKWNVANRETVAQDVATNRTLPVHYLWLSDAWRSSWACRS
jgi:hypothetical protein